MFRASRTAPILTAGFRSFRATPTSSTRMLELPTRVRPHIFSDSRNLFILLPRCGELRWRAQCSRVVGASRRHRSNARQPRPLQILPTPMAGYCRHGRVPEPSWQCTAHGMDLPVVPANRLCTRYAPLNLCLPGRLTRGENTGSDGFIAINNADSEWSTTFMTGLPGGSYCNVIDGSSSYEGTCTRTAYVSFSTSPADSQNDQRLISPQLYYWPRWQPGRHRGRAPGDRGAHERVGQQDGRAEDGGAGASVVQRERDDHLWRCRPPPWGFRR